MNWLSVILFIFLVCLAYYSWRSRRKLLTIEEKERKKMEARRSSFISIISHQLRTPLSVVKGYLEALSTGDQGELNSGQKEYLDEALKINKDTIRLVNDYLKAVQLDSTHVPVKLENIDIVSLVKDSVKKLQLLAKAYNVELVFKEPAQEISLVKADYIKLQQVVENIIANAIKYTSGRGRATVSLREKDDGVEFSCQDTGVGIPTDQQKDIFTKFFRARNVINKDTKGSGLGLYLAKIIIEASGGKIWLESEEGKGTTVFFELKKAN